MTGPATARALALEALRRVIDEGAYSNRLMPGMLARSSLDRRDRAFATELTFGTLRRLVPIDRAIEARASRPLDRITTGARHALRLGAYQLLFAGVAPHAAVQETVGLVDVRERGFVNAVLRAIAARPPAAATGGRDTDLESRTGLSAWAVRELRHLVGEDAERAAEALASQAPLTLRVNGCVTTRPDLEGQLAAAGAAFEHSALDEDCLVLRGGDPTALPGFVEGHFAIQDQSSAFVVRTLDPGPGERVLDACAAPGGKAAFAACLVTDAGRVVAADRNAARLARVAETSARLHAPMSIVAQDARYPALRGGFDRILVDAPCSGIGSARRRPELLWRVPKTALSALARQQVAITTALADLLRPGGRLVYAVCTFPRAETDAACDAIVRHRPDLHPVATPGPDGALTLRHRLWPHIHGSDGMFVAAFERRA